MNQHATKFSEKALIHLLAAQDLMYSVHKLEFYAFFTAMRDLSVAQAIRGRQSW